MQTKTLEDVFHKPLIIGASVSANHLAPSPGRILASQLTNSHLIKTVARNGYPGREILKSIHEHEVKDRTIIIGMDLFFWDATLPSPHLSLSALHRLVQLIERHQIPLILGDIPELLPGWQQSRKPIQDEIHRLCNNHEHCLLFPLEHIYKDVLKDGFIEYKGRQHNLWELVPDGLHIANVAGEYLADRMAEIVQNYLERI